MCVYIYIYIYIEMYYCTVLCYTGGAARLPPAKLEGYSVLSLSLQHVSVIVHGC